MGSVPRRPHIPDYEAEDSRLDYGGPDQITIHFFDCHGSQGDPAQHVAALTVPDYRPFGGDWDPPSPEQIAAWIWNFRAAIWKMDVFLLGVCFTIVGRDDPMPTHHEHPHDPRFSAIFDAFRDLEIRGPDSLTEPVEVAPWP